MRFTSSGTGDVDIQSPDELYRSRLHWSDKKIYPEVKYKKEPPLHISQAIAKIVARHGTQSFDYVVQACWLLTTRAFHEYDFKHGSEIPFGSSIPDWYRTKQSRDSLEHLMEYVLAFLTALGWIVTWDDHDEYVLNFHPLMSLTPEEVDVEIQNNVNRIATATLAKIHKFMAVSQYGYSDEEIGLNKVPPTLLPLVLEKLSELLQPEWKLRQFSKFKYHVVEA